eukprot:6307887-Prymnesium_polylepis.1
MASSVSIAAIGGRSHHLGGGGATGRELGSGALPLTDAVLRGSADAASGQLQMRDAHGVRVGTVAARAEGLEALR